MARTNNLSNFLTDVAAAIKAKLGDNTPIQASQFDTKIGQIETVGTYQNKVVNITSNQQLTVEPDAQYDALSSVSITVAVPQLRLQTKSYEFTSNTVITLEPEQNYDGFSSISLTINVPGSQINNQDKTITSNGTYTADQGYTGLGTVNVNVSGVSNIYKFATLAEAQAKSDYNIGDIAVVMGEKRVPFYPTLWKNRSMVACRLFANKTVTFTETPTGATASWTEGSGSKTTTYTITITVTSSRIMVKLPIYSSSNTYYRLFWDSLDGLTYTFSGGNSSSDTYSGNSQVDILDFQSLTQTTNLINTMIENWSDLEILSKLFSFVGNDVVQNYYRYGAATMDSGVQRSFYPWDLSTLVVDNENQIIDVLPQSTPYTLTDDILYALPSSSGAISSKTYSVLDTGDTLYVSTYLNYVCDTTNNTRYIVSRTNSITVIDKSTWTSTSQTLTNSYSLYRETTSSATQYILFDTIPSTCIMYDVTYSWNTDHNALESMRGPRVRVYVNNTSNGLADTNPFGTWNASTFTYYQVRSLGLVEIKKPDVDMELVLANSILGVS